MGSQAQKLMGGAGRGNKIAIKKTVTRGGKTFQQTFWVSPAEAIAMRDKKAPVEAPQEKKKAPVEERIDSRRIQDAVKADDFDAARSHLEKDFLDEGMAKFEHETPPTITVKSLPMGLNGSHDTANGNIELADNIMAGGKHFLEEFEKLDPKQWAADMAEWSSAVQAYDRFRQDFRAEIEGADGKRRPAWEERERVAKLKAAEFPLDQEPATGKFKEELPSVNVTAKDNMVDISVGTSSLLLQEYDDYVLVDYVSKTDDLGEQLDPDKVLALYDAAAKYAIENKRN